MSGVVGRKGAGIDLVAARLAGQGVDAATVPAGTGTVTNLDRLGNLNYRFKPVRFGIINPRRGQEYN